MARTAKFNEGKKRERESRLTRLKSESRWDASESNYSETYYSCAGFIPRDFSLGIRDGDAKNEMSPLENFPRKVDIVVVKSATRSLEQFFNFLKVKVDIQFFVEIRFS